MGREIFISHSIKDKTLADAIVNLLLYLNVPTGNVFCSSLEGMKIPTGNQFVEFVHQQLINPKLVILLLSPHCFESTFCVAELGGCWALKQNIFPIVIPPLDYSDLNAVLTAIQARRLTDKQTYNELRDRCATVMKLGAVSSSQWDQKVDEFMKTLDGLVRASGLPAKASFNAYVGLQAKYEDALKQMSLKDKVIEELSSRKDKADVDEVLAKVYGEPLVHFEELARAADAAITEVTESNVFREILYSRYSKIPYSKVDNRVAALIKFKFVEERGDGSFGANRDHPRVRKVIQAVKNLENYLEEPSEEFQKYFIEKHEYAPEIDNLQLWHDYLSME